MLDYLAVLAAGAVVGALVKRRVTVPHVITPRDGEDRFYARFHYTDGRVEVRKLAESDLVSHVTWRGRLFIKGEWTPDGFIYQER